MITKQMIKEYFPQARIVDFKEDEANIIVGVFHFQIEIYAARSFLEIKFLHSSGEMTLLSRKRFILLSDALEAMNAFVIDVDMRSRKYDQTQE